MTNNKRIQKLLNIPSCRRETLRKSQKADEGRGTSVSAHSVEGCQVLLYRFRLAAPSCPDFSQEPPARRSCTRRGAGDPRMESNWGVLVAKEQLTGLGTRIPGYPRTYLGVSRQISHSEDPRKCFRGSHSGDPRKCFRGSHSGDPRGCFRVSRRKHSVPGLPRLTNRSWGLLVGLEHTPCQASPGPRAGGGLAQSVF